MKQIIGGKIWNTCFDCHHIVKYNYAIFMWFLFIENLYVFQVRSVQFPCLFEIISFEVETEKMSNKKTARLELSVTQIFLTIFVVTCCIFYLTLFIHEENIWNGSTNIRNYINVFPMPRYELYQKFQPAIPKIFINMKKNSNLLQRKPFGRFGNRTVLTSI
jgi:hypothetical protein